MPKFRSEFYKLKLNTKAISKTLHEYYSRTIREAARTWLRAVLASGRIPVWSGQALATLRPMARQLRVAMQPIKPLEGVKSRVAQGESKGIFTIEYESLGRYLFKYRTTVPYFHRNETTFVKNLTHPTPWHALRQGDLEAKMFLRQRKMGKRVIRIISEHILYQKRTTRRHG